MLVGSTIRLSPTSARFMAGKSHQSFHGCWHCLLSPHDLPGAPTRIGPVLRKPCVRLEPAWQAWLTPKFGNSENGYSLFFSNLWFCQKRMIPYCHPVVFSVWYLETNSLLWTITFFKVNQRAKWAVFPTSMPPPDLLKSFRSTARLHEVGRTCQRFGCLGTWIPSVHWRTPWEKNTMFKFRNSS